DLDPFVTFDEQKKWFHDHGSIFFYSNINGAILASFVKQDIYKGQPPTLNQVIRSADVYWELEALRDRTDAILRRIEERDRGAEVSILVTEAKRLKANFNFLDAFRHADEAAKLTGLD